MPSTLARPDMWNLPTVLCTSANVDKTVRHIKTWVSSQAAAWWCERYLIYERGSTSLLNRHHNPARNSKWIESATMAPGLLGFPQRYSCKSSVSCMPSLQLATTLLHLLPPPLLRTCLACLNSSLASRLSRTRPSDNKRSLSSACWFDGLSFVWLIYSIRSC